MRGGRHGNGDAALRGQGTCVPEVLLHHVDGPARGVVTGHHGGHARVQHLGAGPSLADCFIQELKVHLILCGKREPFRNHGERGSHDHVVDELRHVAGPWIPDADNGLAHGGQDGLAPLEGGGIRAHHDGKGGCLGARFPSAHRSVGKLDALLCQARGNPARHGRHACAQVYDQRAFRQAVNQPAVSECYLLHDFRIRKGKADHRGAPGKLLQGLRLGHPCEPAKPRRVHVKAGNTISSG